MFKVGAIVKIFSDPYECNHFETKAILIGQSFENPTVEMWVVKKLKTGREIQEIFYKKNISMYRNTKITKEVEL